jgi:hypothetical protein
VIPRVEDLPERVQAWIERTVAAAPPLTAEQARTVEALFAAAEDGGDG